MNEVLKKLWLWFWHLLPANPIFMRVVYGGSRRARHLWLRAAYLSILLMLVSFSLMRTTTGPGASLTDLAKGASQTFMWASILQLALICFLAPSFTASAITQERDAQTYNILLSTPLTNAQIVFGSLISRLFFVIMLLLAGLPIFLMTMLYGGVTMSRIIESFALSGSTAVLTGALAIFVATMGVGTRRTIFSFYILIALYLIVVYLLGTLPFTHVSAAPPNNAGQQMSWLATIHPFLALNVSLQVVQAPSSRQLVDYSALGRYALSNPAGFYVMWTLIVAFILTIASIFFVRNTTKTGERTLGTVLKSAISRKRVGERTRQPRTVWPNPVAWREAKTKTTSGDWLRWAIIILGSISYLILLIIYANNSLTPAGLRLGLVSVTLTQLILALLFATNTAATSMTKEKEAKTMDLLLTTLLTSKYILWGKLRGLVSFCLPLLGGPVLLLFIVGSYVLISSSKVNIWIESALQLGALMLAYTALTCVISLQISLKSKNNVVAVMSSMGTIILLFGIASGVNYAIVSQSAAEVAAFFAPFSPFTAVRYLTDPVALFDTPASFSNNGTAVRIAMMVGSTISFLVYWLIVVSVYKGLVRNFDMIVRKQSGL